MKKVHALLSLSGALLFCLGVATGLTAQTLTDSPQRKEQKRTDLTGAHGFGIDCLFVARGIHSEQFEGLDQLDPASVKELFGHPPRALMRELTW